MSITDTMTRNHKQCDELFAAAEEAVDGGDWEAATAGFERFRDDTLRHFQCEEEVLFPAFEGRTGSTEGPTAMMRYEHAQMRALIEQMAEACAGRNGEGYLGASETLMMMMQQHNLKEEQILYPMTEQALGADQGETLAALERTLAREADRERAGERSE